MDTRARALTVIVAAIAISQAGCGPRSDVTIVPPRVPQGGRAVAISVSQGDAKRIIVATETGGLFRTFDGGVSFQHLDAFPTIFAVDVAISSLDPNTIIATARDDFRTTSGGGIWRSTDGGASWRRPAGWPVAGCNARAGAGGISHMPLSRTFYVATDCGLAISTDNGATFTNTVLDPLNPRLFSVLVLNRTTGVAADSRRVWFLNNGQWTPSLGGPDAGGTFTPHAFASPWWAASNIIYHAGRDRSLWVSTTSGGAWRQMQTPCDLIGVNCGNREPFVRVGRGLDGDPTHLDVYYGDGFTLHRQAVTVGDPSGNVGAWRQPTHMDHRDPADLAFTPGFEQPLMLATDGGVHLTPDNGSNWVLTGSNFGGFTALQITEVTGRAIGGGKPHLDLYYATQDNDIKASDDGGASWKGSLCCEGAFLRADAMNPAPADDPVTGRKCDNCNFFVVPAHPGSVASPPGFHNAPSGNPADPAGPPFQLLGASYLQAVANTGTSPPQDDYFLTTNRGTSWAPAFSVPGARVGIAQFAGNLSNPVTYLEVMRGSGAGIFRASGVTGAVSVRRADSLGIFSVGVFGTGQSRYAVVGVDPKNPDHLLAQDLFLGMRASVNGGLSWFPLPALQLAATDSGRFLTSTAAQQPSVTTIAWDPTNSCHILVGTMQNGVIRSADGGTSWSRVPGSLVTTYVTSFFFPPTGAIWMSTYGRGLWNVTVDRRPPASGRCPFPQPPGPVINPDPPVVVARTATAPRPFTGLADSVMCATCSVVLVHDGWITDVAIDDVVRALAISGGYVEQRNRAGREEPLVVPNRELPTQTAALRQLVGRSLTDERRVRGLVLDGRRLVATLVGRDPLAIPPVRSPSIVARTLPGDSVEVIGDQFRPGQGADGVTVRSDADTVMQNITVGANGRFSVRWRWRGAPGQVTLTAVQHDGFRTTAVTTVIAREGRDEVPR